jgi:hypothetical protein
MMSKRLIGAAAFALTMLGLDPVAADAREGVAVIIGNADYRGTVPKAPYAVRDALMMRRQVLTRLGYAPDQVVMLTDVTQAQLEEALGSAGTPAGPLAARIKPGETPLILFYSGHCVPGAADASAHILPVDAHPDAAATTGLAVHDLYRTLQALQPRNLLVILDCGIVADSFAGPLLANPVGAVDDTLVPPDGARTIVIAAAGTGQIANWDRDAGMGLLTRYLLLGMDGAADTGRLGNQDGRVTLGELQSWLTEEMGYAAKRRYGRVQRPVVIGPAAGVLAVAPASGWPPRASLAQTRAAADRLVRSPDDFDPSPLLVPTATATAAPAPAATRAPEAPKPVEAAPAVAAAPATPVPDALEADPPASDLRLESPEAQMGPAGVEEALGLTRAKRVAVQEGLSRIGYDIGRPDGSFGPVTRKAIASWQQASKRAPTGYLTEEQLAALTRTE